MTLRIINFFEFQGPCWESFKKSFALLDKSIHLQSHWKGFKCRPRNAITNCLKCTGCIDSNFTLRGLTNKTDVGEWLVKGVISLACDNCNDPRKLRLLYFLKLCHVIIMTSDGMNSGALIFRPNFETFATIISVIKVNHETILNYKAIFDLESQSCTFNLFIPTKCSVICFIIRLRMFHFHVAQFLFRSFLATGYRLG